MSLPQNALLCPRGCRAWIGLHMSTAHGLRLGEGLDAGHFSITMNLGSAYELRGLQHSLLLNEGAWHGGVMERFSDWSDLGELPSLKICDLVMLKFPPSWDIMESPPAASGLTLPAQHFLSPPSFCSSSHPHRALSGRTSMSGPRVCGFEHHSLSLACCQHSSWFRCRT